MPAAASRATSAGVKMPLSPTRSRSEGTSAASRSDVASVVSKVLRSRLLMPMSGEARRSARSKLRLVVDLDEHVHAERKRHLFERLRLVVGDRRHDDQDGVGAEGARLEHLVGVEQEVLAERREPARPRAPPSGIPSAPWKEGASVSTERQAAPPAS